MSANRIIQAYARKALTKNQGSGITTIANQFVADSKAGEILTLLKNAGLPINQLDDYIRSESDLLKFLNLIKASSEPRVISGSSAEGKAITEKLFGKKGEVVEFPQKRSFAEEIDAMKKSGDIVDPNNLKKNDNVLTRKMFQDSNLNKVARDRDRAIKAKARTEEKTIEEQIKAKFDKQNKESIERLKNKKDDPEGFYTGGMVDVEPNLSDIGHGSDALMARTRLVAPDSQATTSTGLNYLLAEDNDNIRVPFADGNGVADEDAEKAALGKRVRELMDEGFDMGEAVKKAMSEGYAEGGRIGFSKGKLADVARRKFMKAAGATGAGIAALKTGLLGFADKAAPVVEKAAEKAAETAGQAPAYFFKLVEKIKNLGTDVPALGDRQKVTKYKDFELTEDVVTGQQDIQRMKVLDDDSASYYGNPLTEETYMSYKPGKGQIDETTKGKTPPDEYEEGTALLRSDREYAGEIVDESFKISDDILEEVGETVTKKAEGGRIGMLAGGGILKAVLKNSADAKGMTVRDFIMAMNPKSIPSNIKNLISKVDLEQLKAGYKEYYENISDMMKTRFDFQKNIEGGKNTPAKELFEDLEKTMDKQSFVPKTVTKDDIAKTELMIKNKFFGKDRKPNALGGIQTMLGE